MPVTRTSRFALHRWDSGADPFNRTQVDTDNLQLETLAALFRVGPAASIGDPTDSSYARSFYYATDSSTLYFCDGTYWVSLGDPGETPDIQALTVGGSASAGSTSIVGGVKTVEFALANHVHAIPAAGTPVSTGTSNSAGTAATIALSDHVHAIGTGSINSSGAFASGVVNAAAIGSDAVTTAKILDANVTVDKLASNSVTTAKIVDSNVTAGKLASDSVTTAKILDANVTADKLASNSVTTAKILNANVTAVKLASDVAGSGLTSTSGVLSVTVDNSTIEINSNTLRLKDSGVVAAKLNSDVAGNGLASTTGVLSVNVDDSTIEINSDSLRLKDDGITAAKIQSNAVTTAKILNANVTADKLASDSVTTAKILDANVTLAKLASGSVNSSKLAAGVYYNATSSNSGGQIRYGTAAVGTIGGSPSAGDLYFRF